MVINSIEISFNNKSQKYNFKNDFNLIFSKKNSKGKTTLLRFILYGLGYNIPPTEGIGDFGKYKINIELSSEVKQILLIRTGETIILKDENNEKKFLLPEEQYELQSLLFGIEDLLILENLLAVFYIDQEKGWTMLNRGKIIGNNRFNIENYISGLSGKDLGDLFYEREKVSQEIRKYNNLLKISEFKDEIVDNLAISKTNEEISLLIKNKNKIKFQIEEKEKEISEIDEIIRDNKQFIEYIENMKIIVKGKNGEKIELKKENILNYPENEMYLKYKKSLLNHQLFKYKAEYNKVMKKIEEKNTLFDMKTILENMEDNIKNINLDKNIVENVLNNLTNQKKKINNKIKNYLSTNNNYLNYFYDVIDKYAIELEIKQYINKDHSIVLTKKLKGYSGKILAQLAFVFKLAYLKTIEEKFEIKLPFIIDSPRTSEMKEDAAIDMMNILKRDFQGYQIIVASVYDSFGDIKMNKIILETGVID
ncbi:uncharacterized protein BN665_00391 [Firmicutes bacterium CAG:460]|nr:uncharacterized protein BN665_00391 [Firmicutes bacterium CAG:460]